MRDEVFCRGYLRDDGTKGIRNKVLVVFTVECSKHVCRKVAEHFQQLGEDVEAIGSHSCLHNQVNIRRLLKYCTHSNVGGVLVIGHGCEYTYPDMLADYAKASGREAAWFYQQEAGGTLKSIARGIQIVQDMITRLKDVVREPMYLSELVIGGECGGSDFTSGLAGNALVGSVFNYVIDNGGTAVFEELSEGVGLKDYLMGRAVNDKVRVDIANAYDKTIAFCDAYGQFSIAPGNMDGGLTTIEEKSMGATVKSGRRDIQSVLKIGQTPHCKGLHLLDVIPDEKLEPAHFIAADPSDMLELIASGCHLVFLVTGRGHVVGTPVSPVIKVTGNPRTYERMSDDIDFCASGLLTGEDNMEDMTERIVKLMQEVCNGGQSNAERMGHREGILYFNFQNPTEVPSCWKF
ncbi:MAG TPA: UxaA family hydrolase [Candidatus Pelethocola excrementipullorum]|nr:UxaA family hydrolase [Candidatus Pelethocola excrementipullorum]